MRKALVLLLFALSALACDSSPRYQYAVGACAISCDGTVLVVAPQDPICADTEGPPLEDAVRRAEQAGIQLGQEQFPACHVVLCDCDIHWSGEECRP